MKIKSHLAIFRFDPDGKPYRGSQAERLIQATEDLEKRGILAQDTLPNGYFVSTVWLPCNGIPDLATGGRADLYETMVFARGKSLERRRYKTKEDATIGHSEVLEDYRKKGW